MPASKFPCNSLSLSLFFFCSNKHVFHQVSVRRACSNVNSQWVALDWRLTKFSLRGGAGRQAPPIRLCATWNACYCHVVLVSFLNAVLGWPNHSHLWLLDKSNYYLTFFLFFFYKEFCADFNVIIIWNFIFKML